MTAVYPGVTTKSECFSGGCDNVCVYFITQEAEVCEADLNRHDLKENQT